MPLHHVGLDCLGGGVAVPLRDCVCDFTGHLCVRLRNPFRAMSCSTNRIVMHAYPHNSGAIGCDRVALTRRPA